MTRRSSARFLGLLLVAASAAPGAASAQTVNDIARRGACSTAGLEGISRQLADYQMCMRPDAFVRFAPHEGISLTSSRVHPYLQASARDALWRAAARTPIQINSAFRTLADQYVLYHSGGCGLAAAPGRSNHQTGRAVDVQNYSAARSPLQNAGCSWLGSSDPVHFDCPGADGRSDAVLAFQKLWNINHPGDRIAEDGAYGPQTESRLARTPAAGFPNDGCGCTPQCDGDVVVDAMCGRGDCAAFGAFCSEMGGAPACVSAFCVADASEVPVAHDVCLPDGQVASCTDTGELVNARACDEGTACMMGACVAMTEPPIVSADAGEDLGDGSVVLADGGTVERDPKLDGDAGLSGGCSASGRDRALPWWLLGLAVLLRRRRRRV